MPACEEIIELEKADRLPWDLVLKQALVEAGNKISYTFRNKSAGQLPFQR